VYPNADIEFENAVGRDNSFEVQINGQLVFSKLKSGFYPCSEKFQEQLVKAMNGEPFCEFSELQKPDCCQQM